MIFKCKACGGNLKYDIYSERMLCPNCENTFTPEELDERVEDDFEASIYRCGNCGAELITADDTEVTGICSYCGTAAVFTKRMERIRKPDLVLPFSVTREKCRTAYLREAKHAFLAPGWTRDEANADSFRAIYIPYWSCRADISGELEGTVRSKTERDGDYLTYTEDTYHSNLKGIEQEGFTLPATNQLSQDICEHIGFEDPSKQARSFHPGYLAGFCADNAQKVGAVARSVITREIAEGVKKNFNKEYGTKSNSGEVKVEISEKKLIYCPVWLMCRKQGKHTAYAAVNGVTGKVVADFPIETKKFLGLAAVLALALFLLLNFVITLRPEPAFYTSLVLLIVGLVICGRESKAVTAASDYMGFDIKGVPFRVMLVLSIAVAAVALVMLKSRDNLMIYIGSVILAGMFVLCCINTFRFHKQVSERRQPHFDRKEAEYHV